MLYYKMNIMSSNGGKRANYFILFFKMEQNKWDMKHK